MWIPFQLLLFVCSCIPLVPMAVHGFQLRSPPPPSSPSRRRLLYQLVGTVGVGAGYGKVVQDVLSRRQDYPNLPTNERISYTYQQTIEQALALSIPFLNNGIAGTTGPSSTYRLRVLELGIGSDCSSIYRKSYRGAISSIARHVSTYHSPKCSLHITGMDLKEPKPSALTDARKIFLQDVYSIINHNNNNIDQQVSLDDLLKDGWDFSFVAGNAQDLAKLYPSDTFDVVTCSYLLCSVTDPQDVLQEIYRLLKPDRGVFGFVEHVAVDPKYNYHGHRLLEIQQLALDPLQQAVANNCHLHRYTEQSIQNVFGIDSFVTTERFFVDEMWPVSCQMLGVVRKV